MAVKLKSYTSSGEAQLSRLYSVDEVRSLDSYAINHLGIPGIRLMKRAGRSCFDVIMNRWPALRSLTVMCGSGNNAGDGYIVAALAAQSGIKVKVFSLVDPARLSGDAQTAFHYAQQERVEVMSFPGRQLELDDSELIVDGLLGTGFKGELRDNYVQAIDWINAQSVPVVALDIPSGLAGDTGELASTCVEATITTTFVGMKKGLLTGRAPNVVGELIFCDLDVPDDAYQAIEPSCVQTSTTQLFPKLNPRRPASHKGSHGHALIVGGNSGMGGAAILAAESCARSGAGLTSVATRAEHVLPLLARLPEVMAKAVSSGHDLADLLSRPKVVVIGPGLGQGAWAEQMLQQAYLANLPMVIDADALNLLAKGRVIGNLPCHRWVLTPHPGEAARLLDCSLEEVQKDRFSSTQKIQQRYGGVVVLKGAGTIIATSKGVFLANVGNPGLAVGGSGDVLSGVIGALIAQGLELDDAAKLAVCVHGDAADMAVEDFGERGMLASDLIPYIRELLN
ncbi:NAD(P)H-hydrate dehydratase [Teredinibacter sp. KSP-S5-2]|uniref:NAD(P)H-hydrate dehydratase n=1 Tax=Teredinibacter sp. KSP-S5-2 TaxID=3034506 RepID=UPI0029347ED3|nr:NAD(P)H-hydrate dehydratase [Teredinibacter sp. KSP-S5-2]WNO08178.1 NAD(P)H-hydrate dehydratase [Teredinibacter sp. KSP-S5-2]